VLEVRFESSHVRPTGVLVLSGRLDRDSAHELRGRVDVLVDEGWHQLVVDLHAVPFVDCSGLGALVGALRATRRVGGDCRLASSGSQVRDLLQASTLDRVMAHHATVEDALAEYL
jgi:anti-sigma B factor antagonist